MTKDLKKHISDNKLFEKPFFSLVTPFIAIPSCFQVCSADPLQKKPENVYSTKLLFHVFFPLKRTN